MSNVLRPCVQTARVRCVKIVGHLAAIAVAVAVADAICAGRRPPAHMSVSRVGRFLLYSTVATVYWSFHSSYQSPNSPMLARVRLPSTAVLGRALHNQLALSRFVCQRTLCDKPNGARFPLEQYEGLWKMLSLEDKPWPRTHAIAVVGPTDGIYRNEVEACCHECNGCKLIESSVQAKSRWQSVRISIECDSPDDFCELHWRLRPAGTRAVI